MIRAPVLVSTDDDQSDQVPKIATLANGNYALSWNRLTTETGTDIYTRVYTAAGVPLTGETLVADGAGVEIAALETGGYALTFVTSQVMTAVYDNSGALVVAPVTVAVWPAGFPRSRRSKTAITRCSGATASTPGPRSTMTKASRSPCRSMSPSTTHSPPRSSKSWCCQTALMR